MVMHRSPTHIFVKWFILTALCSFAFSQFTYYVDQLTQNVLPDGSREQPFPSLSQAIDRLGEGNFELILLGKSITLDSTLTIPSSSEYTIKPDPNTNIETHFSFILSENGFLQVNGILTLEEFRIIEMDVAKTAAAFTIGSDGILTLKRILFQDFLQSSYTLVEKKGDEPLPGQLNILQSQFNNVENITFTLFAVKLTIKDTIFYEMRAFSEYGLFNFDQLTPDQAILLKNVTIENTIFGDARNENGFGFAFVYPTVDITIDQFVIRNVTTTKQYPFFLVLDTSGFPQRATFTFSNILIENTNDGINPDLSFSARPGSGFFHVQGTPNLLLTNFSVINSTTEGKDISCGIIQIIDYPIMKVIKAFTYDNDTKMDFILPDDLVAVISGVSIQNSVNPTFTFMNYYDINFDQLALNHNTYSGPEDTNAIFNFRENRAVAIKNIKGINNTGLLFGFRDVYYHTIMDCQLTDTKISQKAPVGDQLMINIERGELDQKWADPDNESVALFQNISINGFTDIDGIDSSKESNDTYLIRINCPTGKFYMKDFQIYNVEMGAVLVSSADLLSIDNFTSDVDVLIPSNEIARHRIIQIAQAKEVSITNSRVFNDNNVVILTLYPFIRGNAKPNPLTKFHFENNTISNNSVPIESPGDRFSSLFMFKTWSDKAEIVFKNCVFKKNTVSEGIILIDESSKMDVDLLANIFENNYASETGTALTANSIHDQLNILNIKNNVFTNNTCAKDGGVFFLSSTKHQITCTNNTYTNNHAGSLGGVAYVLQGNITFFETKSFYKGNSAGNSGGSWYMSLTRDATRQPRATFIDTNFEGSASLTGGAFYVKMGDILLQNCNFKENKANIAGGDIYLLFSASVLMDKILSTNSYSPQGSFLYGQSIFNETLQLQQSTIMSNIPNPSDSILVVMKAGSLKISDSSIKEVSSPLFDVQEASIHLTESSITQISCNTNLPFCIFRGIDSELSTKDITFSDISSNKDLIVIQNPTSKTKILYTSTQMLNIRPTNDNQIEIFGLVLKGIEKAIIQDSIFSQITTSCIKVENSAITIQNTHFSNAKTSRLLQRDRSSTQSSVNPRFIVLESSISQIFDSSFVQNSLGGSLNGGALAIYGTQGTHTIQGCLFKDNSGLDGGAISVQGQIQSFLIEDTQFHGNKGSRNGGGIFLSNDQGIICSSSVSYCIDNNLELSLRNITFEGNQAWAGAGVYVKDYALKVEDSIFRNNTAKTGAAMTSLCPETRKISSVRNIFTDNYAELGPALMCLGDLNFENKAFGGDISTKPFLLRLAIYQVSEAFLYLEDISLDYIREHYQTAPKKLVYDSQNSSLQSPIIMRTGRRPNYLFEFSVLDELNQQILNIGQIDLTIDLVEGDSLFGKTNHTAIKQATLQVFKSFYVRGRFSSQAILKASAIAYDGIANNTYSLPSLDWNVVIGSCSVGEIYDSINQMCTPCPENTYSFEDPLEVKTCEICIDSAICLGGNTIFPRPGYWRMTEASDNFVKCSNEVSCIGGQKDEGRDISLTGFCAPGYEGVGCGTCSEGYVKSGGISACLKCSSEVWIHIRYVAFFIFQIFLTVLTVRSHILSAKLTDKERKAAILQSSLIKVIIDFLHVLNLALAFNLDWPRELRDYFDITSEVAPSNKDIFSIDCLIIQIMGNNDHVFFIKLMITILQPIFFILVGVIVWSIVFKNRRRKLQGNEDFIEKIVLTSVIIVYILQPDVLKMTFQIFNCRNFGSTTDRRYFLIEDTSIECWEYQHVSWLLGLAIPSFTLCRLNSVFELFNVLLGLIIPSSLILSLLRKKELVKSKQFRLKYNFIFEKYHPHTFYWYQKYYHWSSCVHREVIVLARKVILIVLAVFLTFTFLQAYLSFVTLIIAFILQRKLKPYSRNRINHAEQISLYSSAGIMYTGLFFVRDKHLEPVVPLLLVVDVISGVFFFVFCIYVLWGVIKQKAALITEKLDKIIDKEEFRWKTIRNIYRRLKQCFTSKTPKGIVKKDYLSQSFDLVKPEPNANDRKANRSSTAPHNKMNPQTNDSNNICSEEKMKPLEEFNIEYDKIGSTTKLKSITTKIESNLDVCKPRNDEDYQDNNLQEKAQNLSSRTIYEENEEIVRIPVDKNDVWHPESISLEIDIKEDKDSNN